MKAVFFRLFLDGIQKEHPQNPIAREGGESEEDKLVRALGMGAPDGENNTGRGKALRGYEGFLTLLYAFTDQVVNEVRHALDR